MIDLKNYTFKARKNATARRCEGQKNVEIGTLLKVCVHIQAKLISKSTFVHSSWENSCFSIFQWYDSIFVMLTYATN